VSVFFFFFFLLKMFFLNRFGFFFFFRCMRPQWGHAPNSPPPPPPFQFFQKTSLFPNKKKNNPCFEGGWLGIVRTRRFSKNPRPELATPQTAPPAPQSRNFVLSFSNSQSNISSPRRPCRNSRKTAPSRPSMSCKFPSPPVLPSLSRGPFQPSLFGEGSPLFGV